ncbi:MAG: excinuclease ABC subunit UvrA [Anaerolineaceae bacterium]
MNNEIVIKGARLHNLKNIDVTIPKNKLVVFTGLSGSGKSTLAFDILHMEGSRQFMESMGLVTHGMSKPPVDQIVGLSPSISVDQHLTNHSPRSTVGTATEVFTYLRVLFARLGHRPCPSCGKDVPPSSEIGGDLFEEDEGAEGAGVSCPNCGAHLPEIGMANFSFNKPAGACPACTGLGVVPQISLDRVFDQSRSVLEGGVQVWDAFNQDRLAVTLQRAGQYYGFVFDPNQKISEMGEAQKALLFHGVNSEEFTRHFPGVKPPATVLNGNFEGVLTNLKRRYHEGVSEAYLKNKTESVVTRQLCPDCGGTRLKKESRQVTVNGLTIIELSQMSLEQVAGWLESLSTTLSGDQKAIAKAVIDDLAERLRRLVMIGIGYLTMERGVPSLSAGEAQRLRLAALLGSGLTGMLYVLDEPTIGLHQRDTGHLIEVLYQLRDLGNTVLVIEHDLEVMRAADWIIEFGPGGGKHGGNIVAVGTPNEVAACPISPSGAYLSGRAALPRHTPRSRRLGDLWIRGAREHNLKDLDVRIPLERLVVVAGVSGSGKSSLIFDILDRAGRRHFYHSDEEPGRHDGIEGWEHIDRQVTVDQSPIGRIPRSNAATYTDTFTAIREAFAATPEAQARKMGAGHFSFNVPGGRCERCEGAGTLTVNMHFLPDVQVRCPVCHGRRFKKDVLAVKFGGYDIAEVLEMTIEESRLVFKDQPAIANRLGLMEEVGLGYLQLGQPATTLSGGEAQRVKLAKELARKGKGRSLYLLDEPTTGLHLADTARLLQVLQRLVDAGNTVVVVEHNLDVIRSADWVIELGPQGGAGGGMLISEGTPKQIMQVESSVTREYL